MIMPHIAILLNWRNQINKSGYYSIHMRIKIGADARYYNIDIPQKVSTAQWLGNDDNWVKNNHPFSFEINNKIIEKKMIVHELIKKHYNLNKPLTFPMIFRVLKQKGEINSFLEFMKRYILDPPEKLHANTLKKYNTCLIHLTKFKPVIFFNEIDQAFVQEFYKFLQVNLKLGGPTIKKYFDALKKVIKFARRENFMDAAQLEFLFEDIKISSKRITKRIYLEPDEIRKWKGLLFSKEDKNLERDRDIFLFQIYTGYYYKDLRIFKKDQLVNDEEFGLFIIGERDKNGNETIIPLFKFPYAITIIEKYASDSASPFIFKKEIFLEEPVYNRNLKQIAALAGITKTVYNKVGRHTNAQLWVRYGAERPIISKMLGHQKEETTRHYFSVNLPEIVEGTRKVDFKRLGI